MDACLSYIVSVLVAIISGFVSCLLATKNAKSSLETVKEANKHDIERNII